MRVNWILLPSDNIILTRESCTICISFWSWASKSIVSWDNWGLRLNTIRPQGIWSITGLLIVNCSSWTLVKWPLWIILMGKPVVVMLRSWLSHKGEIRISSILFVMNVSHNVFIVTYLLSCWSNWVLISQWHWVFHESGIVILVIQGFVSLVLEIFDYLFVLLN
jgi:hypothetical protein